MTKQEVLDLTLNKFEYPSPASLVNLVDWTLYHLNSFEHPKGNKVQLLEEASHLRVKDVIEAWYRRNKAHRELIPPPEWFVALAKSLVKLGMTRIDWIALPRSTVTDKMLITLGKEKLLRESALLLDTISTVIIEKISSRMEKVPSRITIGEILETTDEQWRYGNIFRAEARATTRKLLRLGFSAEDGIFLAEETQKQFEELPMKQKRGCRYF